MNRSALIVAIQEESPEVPQSTIVAVLSSLAVVALNELRQPNGEIPLTGLGKLKATRRKSTTGRNPRTNEIIAVPERRSAKFVPGSALKEALN